MVLFFIAYGYFCYTFAIERMLNADGSFYSFMLMHENNFNDFSTNRYANYLFEAPVLLLNNITTLSVHSFLVAYSCSYALIYFLIAAIHLFVFKSWKSTWVLMFGITLTVRHAFFLPIAEIQSGIAFSSLFYGYLQKNNLLSSPKLSIREIIASGSILFLTSVSHPLTLLLVLFILAHESFSIPRFNAVPFFILIGWIALLYGLAVMRISKEEYQGEQFNLLLNELFSLNHSRLFYDGISTIKELIWSSPLTVAFAILSFTFYLTRKKQLSLISWLTTLFVFIFVCLAIRVRGYFSPDTEENYYSAIGLLVTIPFFSNFSHVNGPHRKKWMLGLTIALFSSFYFILSARPYYANKLERLNQLIRNGRSMPERKFGLLREKFPWDSGLTPAFIAPQTMLLSALHPEDTSVTFFIFDNPESFRHLNDISPKFIGPEWCNTRFGLDPKPLLQVRYLPLPENRYVLLHTTQDSTLADPALWPSGSMQLSVDPGSIRINGRVASADLQLNNATGKVIPSITGKSSETYISYHLFDSGDKLLQWDGERIALEMNVGKSLVQRVLITLPDSGSLYKVRFDLVTEGKRWWDIPSQTVEFRKN